MREISEKLAFSYKLVRMDARIKQLEMKNELIRDFLLHILKNHDIIIREFKERSHAVKKSFGIYLHIPFCLKKCHYCDFCSFPNSDEVLMKDYTEEMLRRMRAELPSPEGWQADTVYFGGGTPTLLPLDCFRSIMDTIQAFTDLAPSAEITVECNPATASLPYLRTLRELGINRLSMGLQSVHNHELSALGRIHTFEDFLKTYEDARQAGFDNISADLMYGIPDGTLESFQKSLRTLAALAPEHISAYGLKIEEGTLFARKKSSLRLPDEDVEFEMYQSMTEILSSYGYRKYEISNFAKSGRESRHNLRYWNRQDYLGFGVAAHSCMDGIRFGNSRDLERFLKGEDITEERLVLSEQEKFEEWMMLGLRLAEGLDEAEWTRRLGTPPERLLPSLKIWIAEGYMKRQNGRIAFTDKGFFVSNTILSEILEPSQKNC